MGITSNFNTSFALSGSATLYRTYPLFCHCGHPVRAAGDLRAKLCPRLESLGQLGLDRVRGLGRVEECTNVLLGQRVDRRVLAGGQVTQPRAELTGTRERRKNNLIV